MMEGKRLGDGDYPSNPGEYSKLESLVPWAGADPVECWLVCPPTGGQAAIIGKPNKDGSPYHWVRENDDGTITVEPNPSDAPPSRRNSNSIMLNGWHGYIYSGRWESA